MIILYVTCKDEAEAKNMGQTLVENKLVACANFFPIKSVYKWKGNIENDNEFVLLLKTTEDKAEEAKKQVKKLHTYEVPCILKIPIEANEEYYGWVKKQIK